ncbi:transglycosylase SLT domain-containing protein [Caviibacterium pharyngocola]|uniref:Lytic murein transglycosylase n=1 Tax=Caviibacterium pharyngocola TaxID=28159 RepID=A0A2M8RTB0_9PAST|nr:transglycosylase SLT domain-containing protein [Caviibacterium pharyngocola]PJG82104.1 lytic murein transglycosylase [Caviibacterium pharyngocola]
MKKTGFLLSILCLSSFGVFAADNKTPAKNSAADNKALIAAESALQQAEQQLAALQNTLQTQQKRQAAREIYGKITQLNALSQSSGTKALINELAERIRDYPLAVYVEYRLLNADKTALTLQNINEFQQRYPTFPFTVELKKNWLLQKYKQQDFAEILTNQTDLPKDLTSKCIVLHARIETAKTQQKPTALFTPQVETLLLTADNPPKQCEVLFAPQYGYITAELLKERALSALEKNNIALLAQLEKFAPDAELKNHLNELYQLAKSPQRLRSENSALNLRTLSADNPQDKRILAALMPALIKTYKESELNLDDPFEPLSALAEKFRFSPQQTDAWKSLFLAQFFDSENHKLQQWRDQELVKLKDDKLTERRIRSAIREKTDLTQWLNLLSETAKKKDEWRYWSAKMLQRQGNDAQAESIFRQMQTNARGFYPMLAAQELGIEYKPQMTEFIPNPTEKAIAEIYAEPLARIEELRYFNESTNANREWQALLDQSDTQQKMALARYAEEKNWYDLQVEATIQAKSWDFIRLRLPSAYIDWFDLFLKDKKIDRTFAMAIARQESAWKTQAKSSANARGLMQLLPSTAKLTAQKFQLPYQSENDLFDPFQNIMLGTAHLQELYDKYGNNRLLIAAAYNAGVNRVDSWLSKSNGSQTMAEFAASIPFYETRSYVQNVLAYAYYYQILQGQALQKFTQEEYNRLY